MRTSLRRRPFGLVCLSLALLACLSCPADRADADGTRHPYFNDRGTLRWHHTIADAKRAAQREGKLIFVEYGRRRCSNCRKLAETVLPHRAIRGRLGQLAVGLAAECDTPEREVWALFRRHLPNARQLPFVGILTADGRWITGWAGRAGVGEVGAHLGAAETVQARILARRTPTSAQPVRREPVRTRPVPQAEPAPTPTPGETVRPTPEAEEEVHEAEEDDEPCVGPDCEGGSCDYDPDCKPRFPLAELFKPKCRPCPPQPKPQPKAQPEGCPTPPAETAPRPAARVATKPAVGSPDGTPGTTAPDAAPPRVIAEGSPDGPAAAAPGRFPAPAPRVRLPQPEVKPTAAAPTSPTPARPRTPAPAPTQVRTASETLAAAAAAAARDDWATVLELTRGASRTTTPELYEYNRRAHAWAHAHLAAAVRSIRARRYAEAHAQVNAVHVAMRGEAEAVDAERGAEAIELMRDIEPLEPKSLVRRTVRKTAYEKMRGTRWAPLFSPVPQPGAAVATK